jgi:hypothetical protein
MLLNMKVHKGRGKNFTAMISGGSKKKRGHGRSG